MSNRLSKEKIQKKVKTIEATYQTYLAKLNRLQKKQNEIISEFIEEIEKRKIEEIKKTIK